MADEFIVDSRTAEATTGQARRCCRRFRYKGRKPSVQVAKVKELKAAGTGPAEIARQLNISRQSVYRALA